MEKQLTTRLSNSTKSMPVIMDLKEELLDYSYWLNANRINDVKEHIDIEEVEDYLANKEQEEYKPYFGWCDVNSCKNEGCSGGIAWKETGYWTVCSKHADDYRNGKQQPEMKQSAIDREAGRDTKTGYLK